MVSWNWLDHLKDHRDKEKGLLEQIPGLQRVEVLQTLNNSGFLCEKRWRFTPPLKPPSHDVGLKLCDVVVALPTSSWFRSHLEEAHLKMHPWFDSNWVQNLAEKMLGQQIDNATTFNDVTNIGSKKPHLLSPHWKHWYAVEWLISIAANVSPQNTWLSSNNALKSARPSIHSMVMTEHDSFPNI